MRAATRDTLLAAAEHVFAEKGIDGARIEDIAARARVAVGTIYNYFGDSTQLLKALISQRRKDLLSRLDQAMADARRGRAPWSGQVEAFIRITLDCTREHHRFSWAPLLHLRSKPDAGWTDDLSSDQMLRFFCAVVRSEPDPERQRDDNQRRTLGLPV